MHLCNQLVWLMITQQIVFAMGRLNMVRWAKKEDGFSISKVLYKAWLIAYRDVFRKT